jgi:hypothetical protein
MPPAKPIGSRLVKRPTHGAYHRAPASSKPVAVSRRTPNRPFHPNGVSGVRAGARGEPHAVHADTPMTAPAAEMSARVFPERSNCFRRPGSAFGYR